MDFFTGKTAGPAHRTDDGEDSPTHAKLPEISPEKQSPNEGEANTEALFNVDIESEEKKEDGGMSVAEQAPESALVSEGVPFAPSPKQGNSTQNSSAGDDQTVVGENEEDVEASNKKDILFLIIMLTVLILLILIAGSFLIYFFVQPQSTESKMKELGFPYRKDMKNGWLFDANKDTVGESYTRYEGDELGGERNEVGCAKKCADDGAFAGSWNTFFQECWCYLEVPNAEYCFERCIIEEGIEFSSVLLQSSFEWCPESYCDIFDATGYCESRPRKNVTDCLLA